MKITLLGTGTSQGVPVIGCNCKVCSSIDLKDKRLRSSVMIEVDNQVFVVDTGPDFRQQMLRENVQNIDAILFTHHHKDHVAGMDDIRAFNHKWKKDIQVYCNIITENALYKEFPYIFSNDNYPGVPKVNLNIFTNSTFSINSTEIIPIKGKHHKLTVYGFRIKNFIYLTDVNFVSDIEKAKMHDADLIILDALRIKEHISHYSLGEAVSLIKELKPKKALFTHISHFMGLHKDVNMSLPENMSLAYDRQVVFLD